jgi:single-strand DNA-binding protein
MAARSLNKVMLIGNLTRDPELRYTPQGTAVCTVGLATNRTWVTDVGDKKEETEFHRIVAWNKLAELCSQLLFKGRRVYVEGRLQTRQWQGQDGSTRQATEIVIEDMIVLDSKRQEGGEAVPVTEDVGAAVVEEVAPIAVAAVDEVAAPAPAVAPAVPDDTASTTKPASLKKTTKKATAEEVAEDIPF